MGKSSAPPPPDYTPIAQASEKQAEMANQLGQQQLQWAKDQYAQNQKTLQPVVNSLIDTQNQNNEVAKQLADRYKNVFEPVQDQYIQNAENYNNPAFKKQMMGAAQAGVAQQFDAARNSAQRQLEDYGINPSSTRYAALDIGSRAQQAAAEAGAGNATAMNIDNTKNNMLANAVAMGQGLPTQAIGASGASTAAGTGAAGTTNNTYTAGAGAMGTPTQYMGLANNAIGNWGNALTNGYNNELNAWKANQSSSSGIGGILGLGAGLLHFADGGEVDPSGAVPAGASPSHGRALDDVPAQLTAGEFVVPREAVDWYGQKHFYGLIDKAQKERQELKQRTSAIPQLHPATIDAIQRSPGRSALPVG